MTNKSFGVALVFRKPEGGAERKKMLVPVELPDDFFIACFVRAELVKLFPVFNRRAFAGNRFEMPVHFRAEIQIGKTQKIKSSFDDSFGFIN